MLRLWVMPLALVFFGWSGCDTSTSNDSSGEEQVTLDAVPDEADGDDGNGDGAGDDAGGDDSGDDEPRDCEEDPDAPQCDEDAALAAFRTNIQTAIEKQCAMCHAGAVGGLLLVKEEGNPELVVQNRLKLKERADSVSAERLFLKISNQSSEGHQGGDQSLPEKADLQLAEIEAWFAAEVGCD